jgi:hypothetical protein
MAYINRKRIDPIDYPPLQGEKWWIVHPNAAEAELRIPEGAVTSCLKDFMDFKAGTIYPILDVDSHNGWIGVFIGEDIIEMPQYLFDRYFDAEIFIRAPEKKIKRDVNWNQVKFRG